MAGSRNFTNNGRGEGPIMLLAIYITRYEVRTRSQKRHSRMENRVDRASQKVQGISNPIPARAAREAAAGISG
jgi:hypothetical protein